MNHKSKRKRGIKGFFSILLVCGMLLNNTGMIGLAEAVGDQAETMKTESAESGKNAAEEAARAESERIAAEEAARAESERIAAEEAARAESERIAAEEAAKAESERIAAEEAARAESERVAAEEAEKKELESQTEAVTEAMTESQTESGIADGTETDTQPESEVQTEPESEIQTEPESETESESESETEAQLPSEFTYEDRNMVVTATLSDAGILPEGAVFAVREKALSKGDRALIEEVLEEDQEIKGYTVYDMHFEADGKETEPENGTVEVSVKYKKALQLENGGSGSADDEVTEYRVLHLDETGGNKQVVDVTGNVNGNKDGRVKEAEFTTDSFSDFVLLSIGNAPDYSTEDKIGEYSLEYILNGFNVVAFGDVSMNTHCMGGVLIKGDYKAGKVSFGDSAFITKPSYVGGLISGCNGFNHRKGAAPVNLYVGSKNSISGEDGNTLNGVSDFNGSGGGIYTTDDYVDWNLLYQTVAGTAGQMQNYSTQTITVEYDWQRLEIPRGSNVNLITGGKICTIKLTGNGDGNTIINVLDSQIPNLPKIEGGSTSEDGESMSIVYMCPNAVSVGIPDYCTPVTGHVVAPDAEITMTTGNYNGCLVGKNLSIGGEGHLWPYVGGSILPASNEIKISKTLNGSPITKGSKEDGLFTFTLKQISAPDGAKDEPERTVTNNGSEVAFGGFQYAAGGTYIYEITETGEVSGYQNDNGKITVTVTVQQNGDKYEVTEIQYAKDGAATASPAFDNQTRPDEEKINVSGSKTWNDNNNHDGKRPESITIRLLADGIEIGSKKVTAADNWSWNFEDLDVYKDGEKITYSIREDSVKGYETEVKGYDVINTYVPQKGRIAVTKNVTFNGAAIKLDKVFYVALFRDSMGTDRYSEVKALEIKSDSADGTATVTFDDLPYGTYYVLETEEDGSPFLGSDMGVTVESTVTNGTVTLSLQQQEAAASITNDYKDTPPGGFTYVEEPETETESEYEEETEYGESEYEEESEAETESKKTAVKAAKTAKTGDTTNYMMYIILAVLALMVCGGVVYIRKRKRVD